MTSNMNGSGGRGAGWSPELLTVLGAVLAVGVALGTLIFTGLNQVRKDMSAVEARLREDMGTRWRHGFVKTWERWRHGFVKTWERWKPGFARTWAPWKDDFAKIRASSGATWACSANGSPPWRGGCPETSRPEPRSGRRRTSRGQCSGRAASRASRASTASPALDAPVTTARICSQIGISTPKRRASRITWALVSTPSTT